MVRPSSKSIEEITQEVLKQFDSLVRELSQEDYRDCLEELISDLEARLDCVKEELRE